MATTIIDELKRIQQSKINMRSVIESKGVGVDPEATIDKYPDFIKQIEGGGSAPVLDTLNVTANGTYVPTSPVDGYDKVIVNVPAPAISLQNKSVTENGTYTADQGYDGLGTVIVNVSNVPKYLTATYFVPNPTNSFKILDTTTNIAGYRIKGASTWEPQLPLLQFPTTVNWGLRMI